MQNYQDLSDTTPIENSTITIGILTGGTAPELEAAVKRYLAQLVLAVPACALVDLALGGGAAGGVMACKVIVSNAPGSANYPRVADLRLAIRETPVDTLSTNTAIGLFRTTLTPAAALVAYDVAIMGSGAVACILEAWLEPQG